MTAPVRSRIRKNAGEASDARVLANAATEKKLYFAATIHFHVIAPHAR